jgi:hypothetical protein
VREAYGTRGYEVSRKLRTRNEHTFAEAKGRHGMDRACCRGLARVEVQLLLTGVVQNLKRLAAYVHRRRNVQAAVLPCPEQQLALSAAAPASLAQMHLLCTLMFWLTARSLFSGQLRPAGKPGCSTGF